ncbi:G-protein coupled receptor Mth2-like [Neodiprion pinetum]|uniref:G-protein coupled receptor Mth2-like n=1 Tax=Neodiprion pinetum TaxID=441929 RepID=UPI001EDE72E0|nr:G-protein coupled receptor Mth2-like isoform X1 [Neodiprion pinetum]
MAARRRLLLVILASNFLPGKSAVDGYSKPCSTAAIVNRTEKAGEFLAENGTQFEKDCICNWKTCLPLCCPLGQAKSESNSCVEDSLDVNLTDILLHSHGEMRLDKLHPFNLDPCGLESAHFRVSMAFGLLENGSLYLSDYSNETVDVGMYCLYRDIESPIYSAKLCNPRKSQSLPWLIGCIVCAFFALATFIVYTVVPELRNLHGLIFRLYLASYIGCIIMAQSGLKLITDLKNYKEIIHAFVGIYFCLTCALWLNVMSFDIWWTLRSLAPIQSNVKERERKRLRWYMAYAWLGPGVLMIVFCFVVLVGNIRSKSVSLCFLVGPIVTAGICNTCLYIATAITIIRRRKDTSHLVDGVNKHHQENVQWFNLYLKLFVVMGGPMIWLVATVTRRSLTYKLSALADVLQMSQCIMVFIIFVWKDDVKRSLRRLYARTMHKLPSSLRADRIHTTVN